MKFFGVMTAAQAKPIVETWIDEAAEQIEAVTGEHIDRFDIAISLADRDWLIILGEDEEGHILLNLNKAMNQLSFIVEDMVKQIKEEQSHEN